MKKYWGILSAILVAVTLTGCGNHNQSKSSDTKKVTTHKVAKTSHKKKAKKTTKKTTASATCTAFSNRQFIASAGEFYSGVFFKGNQFIWKYTAPTTTNSDGSSSNDDKFFVLQGTYKYLASSKILTLNINNQSKTYTGKALQLDKYQYQSVSAPAIASTLQFKVSDESGTTVLQPMSKSLGNEIAEANKNGKDDPNLTYDNVISKYSVQKVDSSMQQVKKGISSAAEFQDFIVHNMDNPNPDLELTAVANDGKDYDIYDSGDTTSDTPQKTVKAKYTLHVNNPVGGSEKYFLGDDDNIYWSPEQQTHNWLEEGMSTQYHQLYNL